PSWRHGRACAPNTRAWSAPAFPLACRSRAHRVERLQMEGRSPRLASRPRGASSPDAPRRPPAPVRRVLFASTCVLSAGGGPDDARDLEWVAAINLERLGVVVVLDGSRLHKWVAVDGQVGGDLERQLAAVGHVGGLDPVVRTKVHVRPVADLAACTDKVVEEPPAVGLVAVPERDHEGAGVDADLPVGAAGVAGG